jgi:SAM-dependent methyltransferase
VDQSDDRSEIVGGELRCVSCDRRFPIVDGIPYMEPDARSDPTGLHFGSEFTVEAGEDQDFDDPAVLEYLFYTRTGLDSRVYDLTEAHGLYPTEISDPEYVPDKSRLKGKTVLDAGCGGGRFLPLVANSAERVVGLDLGPHVHRAALRAAPYQNVDVVQGSVLAPPFRLGTFDYAYSLGVLHHTPSPREGALALADRLRTGGAMSIWVYSRDYWGRFPRNVVGKALHSFISRQSPQRAHRIAERWLLPLGRLQARLAKRRWTKLVAAPVFLISVPRHPSRSTMITTILDYYGPPIIHTHEPGEVEGWLRDAGFRKVKRLPVPVAAIGNERRGEGSSQAERPVRLP